MAHRFHPIKIHRSPWADLTPEIGHRKILFSVVCLLKSGAPLSIKQIAARRFLKVSVESFRTHNSISAVFSDGWIEAPKLMLLGSVRQRLKLPSGIRSQSTFSIQ